MRRYRHNADEDLRAARRRGVGGGDVHDQARAIVGALRAGKLSKARVVAAAAFLDPAAGMVVEELGLRPPRNMIPAFQFGSPRHLDAVYFRFVEESGHTEPTVNSSKAWDRFNEALFFWEIREAKAAEIEPIYDATYVLSLIAPRKAQRRRLVACLFLETVRRHMPIYEKAWGKRKKAKQWAAAGIGPTVDILRRGCEGKKLSLKAVLGAHDALQAAQGELERRAREAHDRWNQKHRPPERMRSRKHSSGFYGTAQWKRLNDGRNFMNELGPVYGAMHDRASNTYSVDGALEHLYLDHTDEVWEPMIVQFLLDPDL